MNISGLGIILIIYYFKYRSCEVCQDTKIGNLPSHIPSVFGLHLHEKPPIVFVHVAFTWHGLVAHSSRSEI